MNYSSKIFTLSNCLSLSRAPLALFFLSDNILVRALALVLAMITDYLDGYLARRNNSISSLGVILDPLMDKFFVFIILIIFIQEGKLEMWQALTLVSRDFAILLFGFYLAFKQTWADFQFQSIWAGKVTTSLQFFVLLSLTFKMTVYPAVFACFVALALLVLVELYYVEQKTIKKSDSSHV